MLTPNTLPPPSIAIDSLLYPHLSCTPLLPSTHLVAPRALAKPDDNASIMSLSGGYEKSVKGGTKSKLAAPKTKYVLHLLDVRILYQIRTRQSLRHNVGDESWRVRDWRGLQSATVSSQGADLDRVLLKEPLTLYFMADLG